MGEFESLDFHVTSLEKQASLNLCEMNKSSETIQSDRILRLATEESRAKNGEHLIRQSSS